MKILIISTSLNPNSKSKILAKYIKANMNCDIEFIDLLSFDLPMCDGGECYNHPNTIELKQMIENCDGIVFALPIYNYGISANAKTVIELGGKTLSNKLIGFLCAAGGSHSYMSVMGFANSLMLDFRCLILPRFVYAKYSDFEDGKIVNEELIERLNLFCDDYFSLCQKLCD